MRHLSGFNAVLCAAGVQAAQVAGVVVQVSGAMSARSPAGAVKALQVKSEVESGDTLVTSAGAYAWCVLSTTANWRSSREPR
jgi:hypothetical protein